MSGRDIVRVEIDGKEINFYLSTGKALKDQVEWPSDHWYAIPGMGRQAAYDKDDKMIKRDGKVVYSDDEWINKFDKVTSRHYGSDKIREVSRALKVASDAESLSNQLLNNPLDQYPSKTIASINRGLKQMDYAGPLKDQISIYDDLFRGFLKTTLKERYPLAVGPTLDKDVDRLAKDFKTLGDREVLEHYKSWFRRETPDVKQIEKSF